MNWRNRIVGHEEVDPLTLTPHPQNIYLHPMPQRKAVTASLGEIGQVRTIVANQRTRHILNGHLRVEIAIAENIPTVPVTWIDVTEDEERVILVFFDRIGEQATIETNRLTDLLQEVFPDHSTLQGMLDDWAAQFETYEEPFMALPDIPAEPAFLGESLEMLQDDPAEPASPLPVAPPLEVRQDDPAEPRLVEPAEPASPSPAAIPLEVRQDDPRQDDPRQDDPAGPRQDDPAEPRQDDPAEPASPSPAAIPLEVRQDDPRQDDPAAIPLEVRQDKPAELEPVPQAVSPVSPVSPVATEAASSPAPAAAPSKKPKPPVAKITIGEYEQELPLELFTPWYELLQAEANGDPNVMTHLTRPRLEMPPDPPTTTT